MSFSLLLPVHISAGILGILSGATALSFRKGSRRHAQAGKIFVLAMLTMAASAVYLALMKHQTNNVFGGVLTFYLLSTAWLTARRGDRQMALFDWVAPLAALTVAAVILTHGVQVARSPARPPDDVPAGMYFFMGSVALLSAAGDVRMLARGGVTGTKRLVRHLWRMCFGLFIATGSFFLGQQQVFPVFIRKSGVLFIPAILPLLLLIFWFFRVRFTNAYKRTPIPRGGDVYSLRT